MVSEETRPGPDEVEAAMGPAEEADEEDPWTLVPSVPMTVDETGIPEPFLRELLLKTIWAHDKPTQVMMSEVTGLHVHVVDALLMGLSREGLCEIDTESAVSTVQFRYRLSERGKTAAHEALDRSRYIGVAPAPVAAYNKMIAEQVKRMRRPPLEDVRKALHHLVLPDRLIEILGQSFFSRRAMMIYGPSGNGKTDIVTSIAATVAGTVVIPYALYGQGQLIRVFDPDVHKSVITEEEEQQAAEVSDDGQPAGIWADRSWHHDRRWLPVSRPTVIVGGDMGAEALEMSYDATQGVHMAPLSIVAQGGVLVIDDLGRQKISPKEILNRWVLMMEQGYDSFALSTSEIVRLPLDVTLVFSTNLTLEDLIDEAYQRRIAYKVPIPNPNREQLAEITRRFCQRVNIQWAEDAVEHLMDKLYAPGRPEPHGCFARDIVTTVMDEAEFQGREPILDKESIDTACALYLGTSDPANEIAA